MRLKLGMMILAVGLLCATAHAQSYDTTPRYNLDGSVSGYRTSPAPPDGLLEEREQQFGQEMAARRAAQQNWREQQEQLRDQFLIQRAIEGDRN